MGSGRPQAAGHPIGAYGESERELSRKLRKKTGKGIALPGFVYESHAEANRQTGISICVAMSLHNLFLR